MSALPPKATSVSATGMSVLCQKQTFMSPRAPKKRRNIVHSVAQAASLRCPTRISWITSNTRTPSSFGIGASHGEASKVVRASESPCCHRSSMVGRALSLGLARTHWFLHHAPAKPGYEELSRARREPGYAESGSALTLALVASRRFTSARRRSRAWPRPAG
jgi:hypothetical protein